LNYIAKHYGISRESGQITVLKERERGSSVIQRYRWRNHRR